MTTTPTTTTARGLRYLPLAELCLALLTLATVYGFRRVFTTDDFVPTLVVVAVYSSLAMVVTRRRGLGVVSSLLLGAVGLVLVLTYLFFAETTRYGLPSGATLDATRAAFSSSWSTFQSVVAPAPVEDGFLLAASVALFFAVFLADWAAFRLWSTFEAMVPATTLFVFCALLGSTQHRLDAVVVFVAAAVAFLLAHRIARRETSTGWVTDDVARGSDALLRAGVVLGVLAVLGGIVLGQRLPGAESGALVSWRGSDGPKGDRFTVSPLVEISSRLVQQSDTELFTVQADREAYWRLTSLDTFDGSSWRSKGRFTVADGDLETPRPPAAGTTELDQRYNVTNLARLWIPAAYQVDRVEDAPARYEADSGTLIVDTSLDTSDGLQYSVRSAVPTYSADELRTAPRTVPEDVRTRYLDLPADFADSQAAREARTRTAGATTDYDRARELQDWFRDEFEYSLEVQPGHGEGAINDFLRNRKGYCEQFAGTFAAMARSLGIPARVAVGFTWGDADPSTPGLYRVKGRHAHAWPEVYLGPYGWVAFEPTPTRGAPNSAAWTGVEARQAESTEPAPSGTGASTTTTATTTDAAAGSVPTVPELTAAPPTLPPTGADEGGSPFALVTDHPALSVVLGLVLLAGLALFVGVPAAYATQRRRRRARAGHDPSARVRLAWEESLDELALVGSVPSPSETHDEFAARAGTDLPTAAGALSQLARDTDAATYAPDLVDTDGVRRASAAAEAVVAAVDTRVGAGARFRRHLDPRPLLARRRRRRPWHEARLGG
ncbi:MAG: transglutaminaseTgpA domain-containing protein [Acidimicrobiales bacterium]